MKLTVEMNDAEFISYNDVTVKKIDGEIVLSAPNGWAVRLDKEIATSILAVGNRDNTPYDKPRRQAWL